MTQFWCQLAITAVYYPGILDSVCQLVRYSVCTPGPPHILGGATFVFGSHALHMYTHVCLTRILIFKLFPPTKMTHLI